MIWRSPEWAWAIAAGGLVQVGALTGSKAFLLPGLALFLYRLAYLDLAYRRIRKRHERAALPSEIYSSWA